MFKRLAGAMLLATISTIAFAATTPATVATSSAGKIWVDPNGMTLYTFDKDKGGEKTSACTGGCIKEWPPLRGTCGREGKRGMDRARRGRCQRQEREDVGL